MAQINKPNTYFNTKLYTGNGTTDHAITGVGFQPDLTWVKNRTSGSPHILHQVGFTAGQYLRSNTSDELSSSGEMIKSLDSDGFTIGTRAEVNTNSSNYVSWNWLAGGTAVSNTQGSITSNVSANTTSGFSVVSYTGNGIGGATVGHGLGATPKMFIVKRKDVADGWWIYNSNLGSNDGYLILNSTAASSTAGGNTLWNSTAPTNQVFSIGTNAAVNASSGTYVAYCFSEVKGFSKFGSYTGNGSTNGTFVYTGFKPAMVILKDYTSGSGYNWIILDNKRDPSNGLDRRLQPSSSFAEYTDISDFCDFTSNGFKWRGSQANWNGSGVGYIYMAFAENPLVGTNNIPATAR